MTQTNQSHGQVAGPCGVVIFGASGDLTKRKLIPALCNLAQAKLLPSQFAIVGFAHNSLTTEAFRLQLTEEINQFATNPIDPGLWQWFVERIHYVQGDFQDAAAYSRLKEKLAQVDQEHGTQSNWLFYLAVAPRFFSASVQQLGAAGLAEEKGGHWRRVIIEKPFGRDLDSARQLNREIKQVLEEPQIYRIDHYLGKETVQNIMVLRFANSILEPIWNRNLIDHVQITALETVGVEHRGGYYDTSGALRDMVPNHLFQLLSLTAMEPPVAFDADAVRDKQSEVLRAIQPPSPEDVLTHSVRGQYGERCDVDPAMPGYRQEEDVPPDSNTETYLALKVTIDNWRWAGVPFYLRTGKRMAKRVTEIAIQFRRAPMVLFRNTDVTDLQTNRLLLHIQPEEGIAVRFGAKIPGPVMNVGLVNLDFDYSRGFGAAHSTGYERLLHDCMVGDATLFQRADMVEAGWRAIQPVLDVWKALPARSFPNYTAGSWGPMDADQLMARDGREWRHIENEPFHSSGA
jgi:glucose-6-phosphate 1-dehydrogenase